MGDLIDREAAIAALLKQPRADSLLADPRQRLVTAGEAIDILRSLPSAPPEPLTREGLDELIEKIKATSAWNGGFAGGIEALRDAILATPEPPEAA